MAQVVDLDGLRATGRVVADTLAAMRAAVAPGVTTAQLDAVAAEVFAAAGARSGPQLDYDFPGVTCISVNEEAVHGIPGERALRDGDLVKLDVTAELDGFYADACVTVPVGDADPRALRLVACAERALAAGLRVAKAGTPLNEIGATVERIVEAAGYGVCVALTGHGIGRRIHEPPEVPNHYVPELTEPLLDGQVMTIEPIIAAGTGETRDGGDGWTVVTADGTLSAHAEHTVVIGPDGPLILTSLA